MRLDRFTSQSLSSTAPAGTAADSPTTAGSLAETFLAQARGVAPNSRFTIYTAFTTPTERAQAVRDAEKAAALVNHEISTVTTAIKITGNEVALSVIGSRDPSTVRALKSGVGDF